MLFNYSYFPGCYCRAQLFGMKIADLIRQENKIPHLNEPFKHFMYGSFFHLLEEENKVREVQWKFHVAPIVKLRDNELYVLDPLMYPEPVKKDEYHSKLIGTKGDMSGYVTCQPDTYDNAADCFNPDRARSLQSLDMDAKMFLDM